MPATNPPPPSGHNRARPAASPARALAGWNTYQLGLALFDSLLVCIATVVCSIIAGVGATHVHQALSR